MQIGIVKGWRGAAMAATRGKEHLGSTSFSSIIPFSLFTITKRKGIELRKSQKANTLWVSNAKKANLSASKRERISVPIYSDSNGRKAYHISEFLNHPSGIEAMLNTNALQSFQHLDNNTYRCALPKIQLLNFEAAPVLDLRVTPTDEDCTVELLCCKFEGSDLVERQNSHFSAIMTNHMTWDDNDSESFLEVDVKLNLSLEIYTQPFTLLPVSTVEIPGNLVMQALVDSLVPLLLQQLLQDYGKWVNLQLENPLQLP